MEIENIDVDSLILALETKSDVFYHSDLEEDTLTIIKDYNDGNNLRTKDLLDEIEGLEEEVSKYSDLNDKLRESIGKHVSDYLKSRKCITDGEGDELVTSKVVLKEVDDFAYWVDESTNNMWSTHKYTKEDAEVAIDTLIECSDCVDCHYCIECVNCIGCFGCVGCNICDNSLFLMDCNVIENHEEHNILKMIKDKNLHEMKFDVNSKLKLSMSDDKYYVDEKTGNKWCTEKYRHHTARLMASTLVNSVNCTNSFFTFNNNGGNDLMCQNM